MCAAFYLLEMAVTWFATAYLMWSTQDLHLAGYMISARCFLQTTGTTL